MMALQPSMIAVNFRIAAPPYSDSERKDRCKTVKRAAIYLRAALNDGAVTNTCQIYLGHWIYNPLLCVFTVQRRIFCIVRRAFSSPSYI